MKLLHWLLITPLVICVELPSPSTLIDALSADQDYSFVLRLIQRSKLVPTLNRLNGSTFFAPTNDAVKKHRRKTKSTPSLWDYAFNDDSLADNIEYQLRQHLLYHLLNYTLQDFPSSITPHKTLHFPRKPLDPPSDDPPPSPPWLPLPGGLLGGEPQRLRLFAKKDSHYVGVDANGSGGAKVVKEVVHTDNGDLYGIDKVVDLPLSLAEEVARNPKLSIISRLLPKSLNDTLQNTPHLTLFFPTDNAWDALDPIERRYLESGFAENDLAKIVNLHASTAGSDDHGLVGWSETWSSNDLTNFTTIHGHTVHVNSTDPSNPTVSDRPIVQKDIYASNGVLHTVSSLLLHPSIFKLNAEKYLLALNATSFVSFLRAANLSHYVDDEHDGKSWTILAPRDDVFTMWNGRTASLLAQNDGIPNNDTVELKRTLQYHFIPGLLRPQDLEDGTLIETELIEQGLNDGRQKLPVSVRGNGKDGRPANGNGEIGFGEARVIGDPGRHSSLFFGVSYSL
ncbi:hypothetical protein FRC03_012378 [Tulasnella sp. 419]|nr:hypothetical protein FRC03_012378 [Tulasnella sp. 419]